MSELTAILTALAAAPGAPSVLATLVRVEGSSYRRPGARLLLLNGARFGSISGGCLEDDILLRAERVLTSGIPQIATYDTTSENDLVWGVGLGCQGVVRILLEPIAPARPRWMSILAENLLGRRDTALTVVHGDLEPEKWGTRLADESPMPTVGADFLRETISAPPPLIVFGAGDDAQPLVRLAKEIGWHVTVVDSRPAYATPARFPGADSVVVTLAAEVADLLTMDERTFAVIMTHRYAEDVNLLRALLVRPLAYLGMLGPRKRAARLLNELGTDGPTPLPEMLQRLHAPVGLDLGGTTPETVALAIVAEMQGCLAGRKPIHLGDRRGPIHG